MYPTVQVYDFGELESTVTELNYPPTFYIEPPFFSEDFSNLFMYSRRKYY